MIGEFEISTSGMREHVMTRYSSTKYAASKLTVY